MSEETVKIFNLDKASWHHEDEVPDYSKESERELENAMSSHYNLKVAKEGVRASIYALIKEMYKQGDADTPKYLSYKKQYVKLCDEINSHDKMMEVI